MKALILAGGLGTRLREVVKACPKSMATVAGKPFLVHLLERLRSQGVLHVVLCVGYRWRQIESIIGDGNTLGIQVDYSVEKKPLGTAGALKLAEHHIGETFMVMNGDTFLDIDLKKLLHFHHKNNAGATLTLVSMSDMSSFGAVDIDDKGRVRSFSEKSEIKQSRGWINGGVYIFEPSVLNLIPKNRFVSLEKEIFPLMKSKGLHIYGYQSDSYFIDIGTPKNYNRSQKELKEEL